MILGKSVLCSQLIYFLRSDRHRKCLFFFCDFHTSNYAVTAQILRSFCAQIIRLAPDLASFVYDECIVAGRTPSTSFLKTLIPNLLKGLKNVHVLIDGIDEIESSQHRELVKTILAVTKLNCRVLFSTQDIPSISSNLKNIPSLSIGTESSAIAKDLDLIVDKSLTEINDGLGGGIPTSVITDVHKSIVEKAEGQK